MCVGHVGTLMSCLAAAGTIIAVSSAVLPDLGGQVVQEGARRSDGAPKMHPYYLGGLPDNEQARFAPFSRFCDKLRNIEESLQNLCAW